MTPTLQVVILAAGQGKRMRSALPKVLQPLGGQPMLHHLIATAQALAPQRIVVVVGHEAEVVRQRFANSGLAWVEQAQQLGTGHAVQQALPALSPEGVVLVLYGDVPRIRANTLRTLVDEASKGALALLTQEVEGATGYGRIVRDAAGGVVAIVEERDATAAQKEIREINTGMLAAPARKLSGWLAALSNDNAQGEYYLTDSVSAAVAEGYRVATVHPHAETECLGVNSKQELARLERLLQMDHAKALLDAGVTLADPARLDVRGELSCGRDVFIDVNCLFEGRVVLGDGVRIGANCILKDATVGAGTEVLPFSFIDGATIGARARIGPYARLRPDTTLADEVHIGNFVEVKASEFGASSKANHLAYIGDSTVGARVNIGAGTITCNYDGAHKHRTVIEDDVHIGSDVQLVAPVTIGRGATVGAGATITKDVPPGELTVTEKKQVTRPGWQRPRKK